MDNFLVKEISQWIDIDKQWNIFDKFLFNSNITFVQEIITKRQ